MIWARHYPKRTESASSNSPTTKSCEIRLTRRLVQSQAKSVFAFAESLSPSFLNLSFLYYRFP